MSSFVTFVVHRVTKMMANNNKKTRIFLDGPHLLRPLPLHKMSHSSVHILSSFVVRIKQSCKTLFHQYTNLLLLNSICFWLLGLLSYSIFVLYYDI